MRILLVEDNADHTELMCRALTEYDLTWQVDRAVSGEEALCRLAEDEAYDLVFLDYSLPGRNGLEVLEEIRRGEAPPPVVVVTGRGDERVAVEAMKGGAYDYVVKDQGYLQRLPVVARRAVEAYRLAAERKRAEEELQKSEERFRNLADLLPQTVFEMDERGNLTFVNRQGFEAFGYTKEDFAKGLNALQTIAPQDRDRAAGNILRRLSGEELGANEYTALRKDGSTFPVSLYSNRIIHENKPVGLRGIIIDITERKRVEEEIRSLARFPSENPNPVLRLNQDGLVLYANDASQALLRDWGCVVGSYAPVFWRDLVTEALTSRSTKTVDIQYGEQVCSFFVAPITDAGYVNLYGRDITERKRVEEALRRSEERYRRLFECAREAIIISDPDGRVIDANPAAATMLGRQRRQDMLGRRSVDVYANPEQRAAIFAELSAKGYAENFEVELIKQDGSGQHIFALGSSVLHKDEQGQILCAEAMLTDITERRRAEEALCRRAEEMATLVEMNRAITEDIDLKETLDRILTSAGKIIPVSDCSVTLVDESSGDRVVQASTDGEIGVRLSPATSSGVGWVVKTRQILAEEDAPTNPIFDQQLVQRYNIKSALIVPIIYKDKAIGTLGFSDCHARRVFSDSERMMAQALAYQAAIAIQNARLFEQVCAGRERLQTLSRRLVEAQETERRQVARELHDEIGQLLTGLKLTLEMSTRLPADAVRASLGEAQALVNELIERVDELSLNLRPAMLDDLGLLPALLWHFERYTVQTHVRVTLKYIGLEGRRLPSEVETAAYRIVQEALTNVARHAGVSEVTVRVWTGQDTLSVQIEDQGIGFDPEVALAAGTSTGLAGMRERAVLLGGKLTIESAPGAGTCLTAELPLTGRLERREEERRG
jgi:PAS domain S-box-containing protein